MATFEPPSAEKLFFSDKTLACLIDCTPKHRDLTNLTSVPWKGYIEPQEGVTGKVEAGQR